LAGDNVAIGSSVPHWHLRVRIGPRPRPTLSIGRLKRCHGYVLLAPYLARWIVRYVVYGDAPVED
jgi:hypothetical protein